VRLVDRLSIDTFRDIASAYDDTVRRTPDIDAFCTSSRWLLPARDAFLPGSRAVIARDDDAWVLGLLVDTHDHGRLFTSLDTVWGLGCGVAAESPRAGAAAIGRVLNAHHEDWDLALIHGVRPLSQLHRSMHAVLSERYQLRRVATINRHIASLEGGVDGFLSRRTRKFRANLRRAAKRAEVAGITFERRALRSSDEVDALFPRIMTIEATSWKSLDEQGSDREPMRTFVHRVMRRAAEDEEVRVVFALRDGVDVGYLYGAIAFQGFRGLQMSFDEAYRHVGLGNLLQVETIRWLDGTDCTTYDLGAELPYKEQWAESIFTTATLVVQK